MKTLVILSPGFEETEAITVIDLMRRAKIEVVTASLTDDTSVLGSHGILVMADQALSTVMAQSPVEGFDAIVLPGGMKGVRNMLAREDLVALVRAFGAANKVTAAVCAAPLVLEQAGLLQNRRFTCHPCIFDEITAQNRCESAAETDGNVVTGRSAGCAMAWSIALVARLIGDAQSIMGGLAIVP